MSDVAQETPL